jgi:NAD(P)-dependent dehydrogenase (short-subunit alcohol dehydrogenase family)
LDIKKVLNIFNLQFVSAFQAGEKPYPIAQMYSCAKAAANMLTKNLALEFATKGIRVNSVAPGPMPTSMMAGIKNDKEMWMELEPFFSRRPISGTASLQDVAGMVVYLSSDKAKFITGTITTMDGGLNIA